MDGDIHWLIERIDSPTWSSVRIMVNVSSTTAGTLVYKAFLIGSMSCGINGSTYNKQTHIEPLLKNHFVDQKKKLYETLGPAIFNKS